MIPVRKTMSFYQIVIFFAVVSAGHFLAIRLGLYKGKVWVDMPLHVIGGILFGMIGAWILQALPQRFVGSPSPFILIALIGGFSLFGSLLWELYEFAFLSLSPGEAMRLKMYSLSTSDILSDMVMGFLGGTAFAAYFFRK